MDTDGKTRQSTQLRNTYYHLNLDCVQRNNPSHIVVNEEVRDKLTGLQKSYAEGLWALFIVSLKGRRRVYAACCI